MKYDILRKLIGYFCFMTVVGCYSVNAQKLIKGTVTDETGETLPGVNITIEGKLGGTTTSLDGEYEISVTNNNVLLFQHIGYTSTTKVVGANDTRIDVVLKEDITTLGEVVVVGYGAKKTKEVAGAVASVKSEEILKNASNDAVASIQGRVAGVNVQASSGAPGAIANVQIRGTGSFTSGGSSPLYVVDGIPYNGNPNIVPEEIQSMEILKDGAAAAIYGTRASNGVILITTKRGTKGQVSVDYSMYAGVQNITSGIPLMNTQEQLLAEEIEERQLSGLPSETVNLNPGSLNRNTDFIGAILNNNAPIQNHNLTFTKGSENSKTAIIANYFTQDGILKNSDYERLSLRANNTLTKNKFEIFSTLFVKGDRRETEPFAVYQRAIAQRPYQPLPEGEGIVQVPFENPQNIGSFARDLVNENTSNATDINAAVHMKYEIIDGLEYQLRAGGNVINFFQKFWQPSYIVIAQNGEADLNSSRPLARLSETQNQADKWTIENILKYEKSFGDHKLNGTLVYIAERSRFRQTVSVKEDFLSNDTQEFSAGNEPLSIGSNRTANGLVGTLVRAEYNYKDKYIVSASFRRDGSSNFAEEFRNGNFYGASLAYNISDEPFFQNLDLGWVENMKIRASFAEVGNQNIGAFGFLPFIVQGSNYVFGGENPLGLNFGAIQRTFANPQVKWETNIARNFGIDLTMLQGKLDFTVDVYRNSKEDMLVPIEVAPSTGPWLPGGALQRITRNVGNMVNQGIELSSTYRGTTGGGLNYTVNANFSRNVNEVTQLSETVGKFGISGGNPVTISPGNQNTTFLVVGRPVASFFLIPTEGTLKTQEEVDAYNNSLLNTNAMLGDLKYVDTNGDGQIDDNDRQFAGSGIPEFELGLTGNLDYRGFDLFVQLYYAHGAELYNGARAYAYQSNRHRELLSQWQPANPDSDIPATRRNPRHPNFQTWSDFFLEDGTYLRVRNITLGYTIIGKATKSASSNVGKWFGDKIRKMRVYVNIQNPLTFTGYSGFDPEIGYSNSLFDRGVDRGNYPVSRRILGGIQINL